MITTISNYYRLYRLLVVAAFLSLAFQAPASAEMVSTSQLASEVKTDATKAELTQLLAREDIAAKMLDMGVDQSEAQDRINSMTDSELTELHAGLESLPAGGDALGIVLTLLLIFLILDLAGVTNIFPGV